MSAIDNPNRAEEQDDPNIAEFQRLKQMVVDGHRARSKWREEAARAYDFVAGWQWSEEDRKILEDQNRPPVTFNRTAPIINAVCGLEVNNRQNVAYLPRKQGDVGKNEVLSAAAKWARDECNAEDEESEAFRDAAICGEGWTETRMDYEDEPGGKIIEERIDPLEMGVNKGAAKANYGDARMVYRIRDLDVGDAQALFPDYDAAALDAKWLDEGATPADGGVGNKKDYPDETRSGLDRARATMKTVRVVQVQWWEREAVNVIAQDGVAELQELPDEQFELFSKRATALGQTFQHVKRTKKVYYQAFLGSGVLAKQKLDIETFNFRCMTGYRDRTKKCFYGLLRDIFDPQRWANKWLSQTMHIMNTNAKGGIMAETDAFMNTRDAERDWADPTKIIWTKPGAISTNKIKERQSAPMPQGLGDLMTFAISSIRDVTGINLELLGQADREQAAALEQQRRQSAMTILAALFDALRRFRKTQGRLMLKFIWMLPDGTLIRITEEGNHKYVPLVKDQQAAAYDTIVDEAPSSPNQKQAIWVFVSQMLQQGLPLTPPVIIKLLKYSPLPETVVNEIAGAMGLGSEMPPEMMKERLQQAEQALQVMEQKLQEAMEAVDDESQKHALEMMKIEVDEYRAETERMKAEWDAQVDIATAAATAAATPEPGQGSQEENQ